MEGTEPLYSAVVASITVAGRTTDSAAVGCLASFVDAAGTLVPAELREPATYSTVFDLASVTKVFTATVLMTLVEDGKLRLDHPVAEWLPSFGDGARAEVTLRHLLVHTSGLPPVLRLWEDSPDHASRVRAILEAPLMRQPGEAFEYSCVGYLVAGLLAEEVTGGSLPDLVEERVCRPLGLTDTCFRPGPARASRAAATEDQTSIGRGMVRGSVHDENAWSLGGAVGNAGLFGTAADLARFGEMLLRDGAIDGLRVLSAESVQEMTRDQLPTHLDPGFRHGLGVRIADPNWMGALAATNAFGHTGFTGTSFVVDRTRDLVAVLLTNRVHPHRDASDIAGVRRAVADLAAFR